MTSINLSVTKKKGDKGSKQTHKLFIKHPITIANATINFLLEAISLNSHIFVLN
jgi:hypothetical protein